MLVKEIMSKDIVSVSPEDTVFQACLIYRDKKVGSLLIMKDEICVGILTERDIIERAVCENKDAQNTKVKEIMSKDIVKIHALKKVEDAVELMDKNQIKKLPVFFNDSIIGIVTATDISKAGPQLSKRFIDSWVKYRIVD